MFDLPIYNQCQRVTELSQALVFFCALGPLLIGFARLKETWLSRIVQRLNYALLVLAIGILVSFTVGTDDHFLGTNINYWTIGSLLSPPFLSFILFFFLDFLVPSILVAFITLILAVTVAPHIPFDHLLNFLNNRYASSIDAQRLRIDFVIFVVVLSIFLTSVPWSWIPRKFIALVNRLFHKKYDTEDLPLISKGSKFLDGIVSTTTAAILCIDFLKCFIHTPSENMQLFFDHTYTPPDSPHPYVLYYSIVIIVTIIAYFVQKLAGFILNESIFAKNIPPKTKKENFIQLADFINLLDKNVDRMATTFDEGAQLMHQHKTKLVERINRLEMRPDNNARDQYSAVANLLNLSHPKDVRSAVVNWLKTNKSRKIQVLAGIKSKDLTEKNKTPQTISQIIEKDIDSYLENVKESKGNPLTLVAIANIYNVNIKLVTSLTMENTEFNYVLIEPQKNLTQTSLVDSHDERQEGIEDQSKRETIWLYHLHKNFYGGLTSVNWDDTNDPIYSANDQVEAVRKATECELDADSHLMMVVKPSGSNLNRLSFLFAILTGAIWILWLIFFGNNFQNAWSVIGYLIFVISEFINYILGLIYYVNFLKPVSRRWKSLHQLNNFKEHSTSVSLIFHYSEPLETTAETMKGCLEMELNKGQVSSSIYICDDGYWGKAPPPRQHLPRKNKYCSWWTSLKHFMGKIVKEITSCCITKPPPPPSSTEMISLENKPPQIEFDDDDYVEKLSEHDIMHQNYLKVIKQVFKGGANQPKRDIDPLSKKPYFHSQMTREMVSGLQKYIHSRLPKEKQGIPYTAIQINVEPSLQLRKEFIDQVGSSDQLPIAEILRRDCSTGTFKLKLTPKSEKHQKYIGNAQVFIVARLKPAKHHNKAGNINNAIFNEIRPDVDTFISFFDNDMKPEPLFLMRTLPLFYKYNSIENKYEINKEVGYVQTPQHFTEDTIAPVLDYLASKNSVFFQAIQKGRDGYGSCAFAGTNATFRAGAIYKVGGFPYGSVTEDALCGRKIHEEGYISIYAEEKLVIGEAPTTVAQSMKQRMRWCKGSIQIFFLELFGLKPEDLCEWQNEPPETENTEELLILKRRREEKLSTYFVQKAFSFDTMLYPVSAITAIGYMFVAFLFVWSNQSPIQFNGVLKYTAFVITFGPYFLVKSFSSLTAYWGKVTADEIWITQQCWFSYAFGAIVGIFDAIREHLTGIGLSWGVTGEAERRNWLEYFNIIILFSLAIGILWRFIWVLFIVDPALRSQQILIAFGGIFFAGTIIFQMWPMVSMSLYERTFNAAFKGDERNELGSLNIPTQVIYIVLLLVVILIGIVLGDSDNVCEPQ